MAEALRRDEGQLALYGGSVAQARVRPAIRSTERQAPLCAGCRTREARYGFRDEADDPRPFGHGLCASTVSGWRSRGARTSQRVLPAAGMRSRRRFRSKPHSAL